MEGILEGILGWIVDHILESKKLKPWAKSLLVFLVLNILTAVLVWAVIDFLKDNFWGRACVTGIIGAIWFSMSVVVCVMGWKRGWKKSDR